jgi:uncharacterized membrane protein
VVIFLSRETRTSTVWSAFFNRTYPADLILVGIILVVCLGVIYLPFLNTTPLRFVFALPMVLFIPGYSVVAAIFAKESDISLNERIALSFGLSITVVPLIGFVLNVTPWGIRLDPIVLSLSVFTLVMILVAYYRRSLLPLEQRFSMPFSEIAGAIRKELVSGGKSRIDWFFSATVTLVILLALVTTISSYPNMSLIGHNYPMYISVGNHENRIVTYTIETWMLRTEFNNETNTSHIVTMDPNDRLTFTLAHNETRTIPYNLSVTRTGYDRAEFLLFNEIVPNFNVAGSDRINASYRNLHLWAVEEEEDR